MRSGGRSRCGRTRPGARFTFDPDELRAAVARRTRLLLVNSPHNPTGTVLTDEELRRSSPTSCVARDLDRVTDEVYEHLTFDGVEHVPLASLPGMRERTVSISSAGKTFSVTGWKIGWLCAPARLVRAVATVKQFIDLRPQGRSRLRSPTGCSRERDWVEALRSSLQRAATGSRPGWQRVGLTVHRAGRHLLRAADVRPLGIDDGVAFARALPSEAGVAAIPSAVFCDDVDVGPAVPALRVLQTRRRARRGGRPADPVRRQPPTLSHPRVTGMAPMSLHRAKPPILLELDLTQPLVEHEPDDPIAKVRSRGKPRLRPVLRALREAGTDDAVAGLVAKVGDSPTLTLAGAQELRDAVAVFAESGKPTVAWSDTFGEGRAATIPYYLATAFREIWLQPSGELNFIGLATEVGFLRGVLDKLDVVPEIGQRHEYKNAADRIGQKGFTPAHREAADRLAESAWETSLGVRRRRARGPRSTGCASLVDRAPLFPDEALAEHLVDRVGYRDEVYASCAGRSAATSGSCSPSGGSRQVPRRNGSSTRCGRRRHRASPWSTPCGGIVVGRSRRSPVQGPVMGGDTISAALRAAVRDDRVRAIVLRVESPGGSSVASDMIWREVVCAREAGKPVVVSMGSIAGSGGYYIACPADVIVAQPGTLTGSIGVLGGKVVTSGLTDRVGLSYEAVQRGRHARMYSTRAPFLDSERERLEQWLDRIYDDFTGRVAQGRGMTRDAVHEVAKGRVWTGADAARIGLVDELGGLHRAAEIARSRAGLPADAPLRPAVSVPPLQRLKPPRSTDDPRAAASMSVWSSGWGALAGLAADLGLPSLGPLTMPAVRLG